MLKILLTVLILIVSFSVTYFLISAAINMYEKHNDINSPLVVLLSDFIFIMLAAVLLVSGAGIYNIWWV